MHPPLLACSLLAPQIQHSTNHRSISRWEAPSRSHGRVGLVDHDHNQVIDASRYMGLLPPLNFIDWCPTAGKVLPTPNTCERIVFASYFTCGFSLEVSFLLWSPSLIWSWSHNHQLEWDFAHSFLITFYECFLKIETHFGLLKYLWHVKTQPKKTNPWVVGGTSIYPTLRQGRQ